jgi:hypothetical protein
VGTNTVSSGRAGCRSGSIPRASASPSYRGVDLCGGASRVLSPCLSLAPGPTGRRSASGRGQVLVSPDGAHVCAYSRALSYARVWRPFLSTWQEAGRSARWRETEVERTGLSAPARLSLRPVSGRERGAVLRSVLGAESSFRERRQASDMAASVFLGGSGEVGARGAVHGVREDGAERSGVELWLCHRVHWRSGLGSKGEQGQIFGGLERAGGARSGLEVDGRRRGKRYVWKQ